MADVPPTGRAHATTGMRAPERPTFGGTHDPVEKADSPLPVDSA